MHSVLGRRTPIVIAQGRQARAGKVRIVRARWGRRSKKDHGGGGTPQQQRGDSVKCHPHKTACARSSEPATLAMATGDPDRRHAPCARPSIVQLDIVGCDIDIPEHRSRFWRCHWSLRPTRARRTRPSRASRQSLPTPCQCLLSHRTGLSSLSTWRKPWNLATYSSKVLS